MTWCCDADDDGSGVDADNDCVSGVNADMTIALVLCRYGNNSSGVNDDNNDGSGLDAHDDRTLVLTLIWQ